MVVGIDVVEDDVFRLELIPLEIKTDKKLDLISIQEKMINGTGLEEIVETLKQKKQYRDVVFRSRKWCNDNNILPFRHMVLSLELGDMAKKRIGDVN